MGKFKIGDKVMFTRITLGIQVTGKEGIIESEDPETGNYLVRLDIPITPITGLSGVPPGHLELIDVKARKTEWENLWSNNG